MTTMRAAVIRGSNVVVEKVTKPTAGPGEVVVRVSYCGICGSDVHQFAMGKFLNGAITGHEPMGVIHELGEGVEGWQVGDRVTIIPYRPCNNCQWCKMGEFQLCQDKHWIGLRAENPGGFAEYVKVYSSMLHKVPNSLDDLSAALTEPLAVALHAVRTAHINLGDTVVVIGAGPIGLLVLQCLLAAGARKVGVVEKAAGRAKNAKIFGANEVFTPRSKNSVSEIAHSLGAPPDFVFDCAGATQTVQFAEDIVRPQGKIILVGISMDQTPLIPINWSRKEAELRACIAYKDEFPLALEFMMESRIKVKSLISGVIPLDEIDQTLKELTEPIDSIKYLVDPWA